MTGLTLPLRMPPSGDASAELDAHLLALETAYVVRKPDVIRSLVRHGLNFVEAEDVTQEVFLRALGRPETRPSGDLFRWLVTCAKNLAVDRYRHCRKEVLALAASWEQWKKEVSDPKANTEKSLIEADRGCRLQEALASLTEPERQCLTLRSQGVCFREIASLLDISPRQAAYLADVAVDKLRRRL